VLASVRERNVKRGTLLKGLPVLVKALERGRCYVDDRGYAKFTLFNEIVAAQSSYVCRLRDNSRYEIVEPRTLCDEDVEAGVLLDAVVTLGNTGKADARPDHSIRLVVVKTTPHEKRGGAAGPANNGQLLIATNLLDLPAWIIALIYRYRWTADVADLRDDLPLLHGFGGGGRVAGSPSQAAKTRRPRLTPGPSSSRPRRRSLLRRSGPLIASHSAAPRSSALPTSTRQYLLAKARALGNNRAEQD
jgi:hypothetical protein